MKKRWSYEVSVIKYSSHIRPNVYIEMKLLFAGKEMKKVCIFYLSYFYYPCFVYVIIFLKRKK